MKVMFEKIIVFFMYIGFIYFLHNYENGLTKNSIKVFVNKPCDKLLIDFPKFKQFYDKNYGLYDVIYVNFDKYPFISPLPDYNFNVTTSNRIDIRNLTVVEIENLIEDYGLYKLK